MTLALYIILYIITVILSFVLFVRIQSRGTDVTNGAAVLMLLLSLFGPCALFAALIVTSIIYITESNSGWRSKTFWPRTW